MTKANPAIVSTSGLSTIPRKGSVYLANGLWIEPLPDCPDDAYDPTQDPEGYDADVEVLLASDLVCACHPNGILVGKTFLLVRNTRTWTAPGTNWKGIYGYVDVGELIRIAKAFGEGGTGAIASNRSNGRVKAAVNHETLDCERPMPTPADLDLNPSGAAMAGKRTVPDYSGLRRYAQGETILRALGIGSIDDLVHAVNRHRLEVGRYPIQTGNFPTSKRRFVRLTTEYAGYRMKAAVVPPA